ncbi:MAG: LPS assembly lipoprotein LptE [Bryobacter sp.]|jgi:hypothetical protein|nr:LPS assembly lipoprotein LptE [Bryobacter sp.]
MKAVLAFAALAGLAGCGYKISGTADTMPKTIRTIAIPEFHNVSTRYKLTDSLPAAITREFIARTRYEIVTDPSQADAVLDGVVTNILTFPIIFDSATGRAAGVQMHVLLAIKLTERATGKVIYNQPGLDFRQRYEIATEPAAYFDESSTAFQRLSQDVARTVVSAVLESF